MASRKPTKPTPRDTGVPPLSGLTVEQVLGSVLRIAPADVAKIKAATDAKGKGKATGKRKGK